MSRNLLKIVTFMKKNTVITYFETGTRVAKALGITKASVSGWGEIIPEKQALRLEKLTAGRLKYDPNLYVSAA